MKKVLAVLVLLIGVVAMGYSALPIPQRDIALGTPMMADNYAFNVFPSLMPMEKSQVWMTFAGGNFSDVALFCTKSDLFNFFIVHDQTTTVPFAVNNVLNAVSGLQNFTFAASQYQAPLAIGYALKLGSLSAGIFVDYQYYNNVSKQNFSVMTNGLDVNNSVIDAKPGISLDMGKIKIDAVVPVRISILKYKDIQSFQLYNCKFTYDQ
jgi:hypothetical protein